MNFTETSRFSLYFIDNWVFGLSNHFRQVLLPVLLNPPRVGISVAAGQRKVADTFRIHHSWVQQ
jgi:hypothetical protein